MRRKYLQAAALGLLLLGCDARESSNSSDFPRGANSGAPILQSGRDSGGGALRDRQAAFLNQLRRSDPNMMVFEKALLNERNELGLVLNRNVQMEEIPRLVQSILSQMAKQFPGQDLTVVVYGPTQPPIKLGTGHLDASTRQMTYTKEFQRQ